MAKTRFHTLLESKLREVIVNRTEDLANGVPKDYTAYMYQVGFISGLKEALKHGEDLEREMD